jgi:hypothetical protein
LEAAGRPWVAAVFVFAIAHLQRIVGGLSETIRLMAEIDDHGSWPGAFQPAAKA